MSSMQIDVVKNGFIVRPVVPERNSVTADERIIVFETYEALFNYIQKSYTIYDDATQE